MFRPRSQTFTNPSTEHEGTGIISNAIANAEKLRPQGQENVSLLQQHSSAEKATPASTQFTFTCDSQVPGTVQWPGKPACFPFMAKCANTSPKVIQRSTAWALRHRQMRPQALMATMCSTMAHLRLLVAALVTHAGENAVD
ncbi:hypothetical protein AUP68_05788 [Ilyonectria robusta]